METSGALYVVATPIGNLEDITRRAERVLGEVDLIAAEDTRHSRKLLTAIGVNKPLVSYHKFNEAKRIPELVGKLKQGLSIALITDAGTPAISDPGSRLVEACHAEGITVVPIPGPSSVSALLSVAGFDAGAYSFVGFLPKGAGGHLKALQAIAEAATPVVFFEAPGRMENTLAQLAATCEPDRQICIGRELTKLHEELVRGPVLEVARACYGRKWQGEVVVVVGPKPERQAPTEESTEEAEARASALAATDRPSKELAAALAEQLGLTRRAAYELILAARGKK